MAAILFSFFLFFLILVVRAARFVPLSSCPLVGSADLFKPFDLWNSIFLLWMLTIPGAGRRGSSVCFYLLVHFINFLLSLGVLKRSVLNVKILNTYTSIVYFHDLILFKKMKENLESWLQGPCNFRSWPENNISMNHEYFYFHIFQGKCKYICALVTIYSTHMRNDMQLY